MKILVFDRKSCFCGSFFCIMIEKEEMILHICWTRKSTIMERKDIVNYEALWDRISEYARKAGRMTTRPVLLLYYVMISKNTSWSDRMLIFSTLSYIVLPIDILDAKRLPIIGWFDEIASLSVTYQKVSKNITPEMEAKADAMLDKWFPKHIPNDINEVIY